MQGRWDVWLFNDTLKSVHPAGTRPLGDVPGWKTVPVVPCDDATIERAGVREKVADALAYNDACGPGPVSRAEYLADADAIIATILNALAGETP